MKIKIVSFILVLSLLVSVFTACGSSDDENTKNSDNNTENGYTLRVGCLKGPTGMGMSKLISDSKSGGKYSFNELYTESQAIMSALIGGQLDIAAVPVNLASNVITKTQGKYLIAAVNTLGVLYVVERGNTVNSVSDLSGKKILANGQASTPEYILQNLLDKNGVKDTDIEFYGDASAIVAQLVSEKANIAMLPEPMVTTVLQKDSSLRIAIDLTSEWKKCSDGNIVQGCIVVSKEVAEKHKNELDAFLADYKNSTDFVNNDPQSASKIISSIGIIDNPAIAEKAIPNCNIVYIDGDEMISALTDFYSVLFNASPSSIGGKLPDESYYYKK